MSDEWDKARLIRASEVGDFTYCHRQWWLQRVRGVQSVNVRKMQMGTTYHKKHGELVQTVVRREKLIYVFVALAVTLLILAFLIAVS